MEIKIGDFGLAWCLENEKDRKSTLCGTPNYIAPEVLMNLKEGYSYEIDTWAIGVVLYAMIVGSPPFETRDVKTTYLKIQKVDFKYPKGFYVSPEAKHLIGGILVSDPKDRMTLKQIREHPFFTKCHYIPKTLPVASISQIIPPNQLKEFEITPQTNREKLENIEKFYFEDRKSKDFEEESKGFSDNYCFRIEKWG